MRRLRGEWGASAVEYALIVAAVAALLVPVAFGLDDILQKVLGESCVATGRENGMTSSAASTACR